MQVREITNPAARTMSADEIVKCNTLQTAHILDSLVQSCAPYDVFSSVAEMREVRSDALQPPQLLNRSCSIVDILWKVFHRRYSIEAVLQ